MSIILPIVWLFVDPSIEAVIALIAILVTLLASWQFHKNKQASKYVDIFSAIFIFLIAFASVYLIIQKRNEPQVSKYPTLIFTPLEPDPSDTFKISISENNVKLELATIYYPSFVNTKFDEYVRQPDFTFHPYNLEIFLEALIMELPIHPDMLSMGHGASFPIIIVPQYVIDGHMDAFIGVYMVDYLWSHESDNAGVIFNGVRLVESFENEDDAQYALDEIAKEAVRLIITTELKAYNATVDMTTDQALIYIEGEKSTINLEQILQGK